MIINKTPIPGLVVLTPKKFSDHRGFFAEIWRDSWLQELGTPYPFIQDNHARSEQAGVVRGLHFQTPPHAQGKLLSTVVGAIYDVVVDMRKDSPTFGKWFSIELSAENAIRLFVPRGLAHGYMTLTPGTEVQYKVDAYYNAEADAGIRWNDPDVNIIWPATHTPILSEKDLALPFFAEFESPFTV